MAARYSRRYRWILGALAIGLAGVILGCGGRNLGTGDDPDATVLPDGQPPADGAVVVDPCAPMDAQEGLALCDNPDPIGWAWDGSCCQPLRCECVGADCDRLHPTQSACAEAHAPACLELNPCETVGYPGCEELPGCELHFYGGGCFSMEECDPDSGDPDDWLCYEQAVVCLPTDHPCNGRDRGDCSGECFWVQHDQELCFEQCCVEEGYGYCAALPGCDCAPQQIEGCSDPCGSLAGFAWDGSECRPMMCCCEGPDCAETWATAAACWAARTTCGGHACGDAGGYCAQGDAEQPECFEGYGTDWQWNSDHPGVCGMGVCCTPCPDETDPDVWYASHEPALCADIDFACPPDLSHFFDNECGCGCLAAAP